MPLSGRAPKESISILELSTRVFSLYCVTASPFVAGID
jgi:hypothetical protein